MNLGNFDSSSFVSNYGYIVSNFGIAIVTTIVGVVSRVWLHQMRDDPLELERERLVLS